MIDTALLISVLVFTVIILLCAGLFYYMNFRGDKRRLVEKIRHGVSGLRLEESLLARPGEYSDDNPAVKVFLKVLDSLGSLARPRSEEEISSLRIKLLRAGFKRKNTIIIFYGFKVFLAIIMPLCFFLFKVFILKALSSALFMTYSISFAVLGFYLPNLWLMSRISKRKKKILEGFPDALDLMTVCVEAGMGLDQAIHRTGKEMEIRNREISGEFSLLSLELRAGKSRREALRNLAHRVDQEEIRSLVSLLIQTDRFGTSVAQALRVHSDSMRSKRQLMAEETAAKLPVKLVFPLIFCIFPALLVILLGPAAIKIYKVLLPALGKG